MWLFDILRRLTQTLLIAALRLLLPFQMGRGADHSARPTPRARPEERHELEAQSGASRNSTRSETGAAAVAMRPATANGPTLIAPPADTPVDSPAIHDVAEPPDVAVDDSAPQIGIGRSEGQVSNGSVGVPLISRGGRPRGAIGPRSASQDERQRKPDLVCRREGRFFRIGVGSNSGWTLHDDSDVPLELERGLQVLRSLSGLRWLEGGEPLDLSDVLFFQLAANLTRGQRVSKPIAGVVLAIVPSGWTIDAGAGIAVIDRPSTSIQDHDGYELDVEQGATLTFISQDGDRKSFRARQPVLDIEGNRLGMTAAGVPVYGGHVPCISLRESSGISALVVGREGPRQNGWRTEIEVRSGWQDQCRTAIGENGNGWFFLRAYERSADGRFELVESTSFSYVRQLQSISISDNERLLPRRSDLTVEVVHDAGAMVEAAARRLDEGAMEVLSKSLRTTRATVVTIRAHYVVDAIDLSVSSDSRLPAIRVPLGRYYWAIALDGSSEREWSTDIIELAPRDFNASSRTELVLRIFGCPASDELSVQLSDAPSVMLERNTQRGEICIALRDFNGDLAARRSSRSELKLRLKRIDAQDSEEVVVARVVPQFACRLCSEFGTDSEADIQTHITRAHFDEVMKPITSYQELAEAYNQRFGLDQLPEVIHKCSFCGYFVPSRDKRVILQGHRDECASAPSVIKGADLKRWAFEVIDDIPRIRASQLSSLLANVGDARRCAFCSEAIFGQSEARNHPFISHRPRLYDSR